MNTSIPDTLKKFVTFVSLFIGTGFIAGSIVHFGEGVTVWDSSVLLLGIALFVISSYVQEYGKTHERSTPKEFALFILQSFLLAIGIGMASGGTQHFIDTPLYAAVLIPLGLTIGLFTFLWREKLKTPPSKILMIFITTCLGAYVLWHALIQFNNIIPESIREGHGSHGHGGHHKPPKAEPVNTDSTNIPHEELSNDAHDDQSHGHSNDAH